MPRNSQQAREGSSSHPVAASPGPCVLVSLKYSPVFWSFMRVMREGLGAAGVPVRLLVSRGYRWMTAADEPQYQFATTSHNVATMFLDALRFFVWRRRWYKRYFAANRPAAVLFLNPHPLNFAVGRLAKAAYRPAMNVVFLHEPHKYDKRAFAPHRRLYYSCVEAFQRLSVTCADAVVVHSPKAERSFYKAYPGFAGELHRVPLLFPDGEYPVEGMHRQYVTFLGHAVESKGIEKFFETVQAAGDRALGLAFQIVTRSRIDRFATRLDSKARAALTVIQGPGITDATVDRAVRESIAVLAPYRAVTQSAVVPVAFRNGTPVIATAIEGLAETIRDGATGYLVPPDPSVDEILEAIDRAKADIESLAMRCRSEFEEQYSARNWSREYAWLVARLTAGNSPEGIEKTA